jgi:hypothetical protein
MTPDTLFQMANGLALGAWALLAVARALPGPWPDRAVTLASRGVPLVLSVGYAAIVLAFWAGAPGGFNSLPDVMALFTSPWIALAGWVHYLAFDLFLGGWAVGQGRARGIPWPVMLPVLALTFLFGPAGFLAAWALTRIYPERTTT